MSKKVDNVSFYCLNYKNQLRKDNIKSIFSQLGISCNFYKGVDFTDNRIPQNTVPHTKRVFSCCYGHFDMIYNFYKNTNDDFGIFCEDDIFVHRDLNDMLPYIIKDFAEFNLDIVLLGYLLSIKLNNTKNFLVRTEKKTYIGNFSVIGGFKGRYNYHNYTKDVWGTQMYMITRKYAKYLIENFYFDYCKKSITDNTLPPFSADWIITKNGNRAILYPPVVTEDNKTVYEDGPQKTFHKLCFDLFFEKDLFCTPDTNYTKKKE